MVLKNCHRLFLQSFMARGILDEKEARSLYIVVHEKFNEPIHLDEGDKDHLKSFIRAINSRIEPYHMKIKKGMREEDEACFYCLVCTNESNITKFSSTFSVQELEYFKKLVESVLETDDGLLGSTMAINLVDKLPKEKKMSKNDSQALLEKLENSKWIICKGGKISLSIRTILELEQYMKEVHEGLAKKCEMCHRLCVQGQNCDNCEVKLHQLCAARLFHNKETLLCPNKSCGQIWPHNVPQKEQSSSRNKEAGPSSKKRKA